MPDAQLSQPGQLLGPAARSLPTEPPGEAWGVTAAASPAAGLAPQENGDSPAAALAEGDAQCQVQQAQRVQRACVLEADVTNRTDLALQVLCQACQLIKHVAWRLKPEVMLPC